MGFYDKIQNAVDVLDRDTQPEEYVLLHQEQNSSQNSNNSILPFPLKTKLRIEMNLASYFTAIGYTTLAAKLLLFNYYGRYNKSIKFGLGLLMYGSCETVVMLGSFIPVYFDSELRSKNEKNDNDLN